MHLPAPANDNQPLQYGPYPTLNGWAALADPQGMGPEIVLSGFGGLYGEPNGADELGPYVEPNGWGPHAPPNGPLSGPELLGSLTCTRRQSS